MIAPGLHRRAGEVDLTGWRWPHFSPLELSCRCGRYCQGEYFHDPEFLDALESLRGRVGRPLRINSARRCALHNAAVGGAPLSRHRIALAVDIGVAGWPDRERGVLLSEAVRLGFTGLGFGTQFLHLDRRAKPARWDYSNGGMTKWLSY